MANEFLDALSPEAEKRLREYGKEVDGLIEKIGKASNISIGGRTPGSTDQTIKNLTKQVLDLEKTLQAQQKTLLETARATAAVERASQQKIQTDIKDIQLQKQKIDLYNKESKEIEKQEKAIAKENAAIEKQANVYNRISAAVSALTPEYNNLAAKRAAGISLTDQEGRRLDVLIGKLTGYQNILKKVDADIGKYGRNVGNYSSATRNLNASVAQISRELPNFV